jgi:hypothetical protein
MAICVSTGAEIYSQINSLCDGKHASIENCVRWFSAKIYSRKLAWHPSDEARVQLLRQVSAATGTLNSRSLTQLARFLPCFVKTR